SHIKGLIVNFIGFYWPSLLRVPGFVRVFVTPIVRALPLRGQARDALEFFTLPQYEAWRLAHGGGAARTHAIKYYKGLGTSTSEDARRYFSHLERHVRTLVHATPEDDAALVLAFAKQKADERKDWLARLEPGTCLD